jgi:polysaccharide biosynthesis protein PelC
MKPLATKPITTLTTASTPEVQASRRLILLRSSRLGAFALLGTLGGLGGCSTVQSGTTSGGSSTSLQSFDPQARWALLPIVNLTETAQAGLRAEAIAEVVLRNNGVQRLERYPSGLVTDSILEPTERKATEQALVWAKSQGLRYGLSGAVSEWRYKIGIDGEPAVGISLQVIDLQTGAVVWSASGAKTGWSREALSAVAQQLLQQLLRPIRIQ